PAPRRVRSSGWPPARCRHRHRRPPPVAVGTAPAPHRGRRHRSRWRLLHVAGRRVRTSIALRSSHVLPLATIVLIPTPAAAHLNSTGLGPVYDGGAHFLASPEDLLAVFALGLLAGARGAPYP